MVFCMDKEYVECCKNYIKSWIVENEVQHIQFSEEVIEHIIENGGDGLRELAESFKKIASAIKEYKMESIKVTDIDVIIF